MSLLSASVRFRFRPGASLASTLLALWLFTWAWPGGAAESTVEKAEATVTQTTETVKDTFEHLWKKIDESRLKNRTPDELAAWVIMGVLVGALAGMVTSLKATSLGALARLGLGLAGAFIGGIAVRVSQIDFGWGPVLIRYEELAFSFVGALLLIVASRLVRSFWKKKES